MRCTPPPLLELMPPLLSIRLELSYLPPARHWIEPLTPCNPADHHYFTTNIDMPCQPEHDVTTLNTSLDKPWSKQ